MNRRHQIQTIDMAQLANAPTPSDTVAEAAMLGSIMRATSDSDMTHVAEAIEITAHGSDDFWNPRYRTIYTAILDLFRSGSPIDAVSVFSWLKTRDLHENVGGIDEIHRLIDEQPHAIGAPHYARLVEDKARRRQILDAIGRCWQETISSPDQIEELAAKVADRVIRATSSEREDTQESLRDIVAQVVERIEAGGPTPGFKTGYVKLDDITGGLKPCELTVIAARPSVGKSALALNMAMNIGQADVPVAFMSVEMGRNALGERALARESGINGTTLHHPKRLGEAAKETMRAAVKQFEVAKNIIIDDCDSLTIERIEAKARCLVNRHHVRVLFVDYLQLVQAEGDSRVEAVGKISGGLKAIAKRMNLAVVAMSQLNRQAETRDDKRPRLADLRESGSIEQDADLVLLLYREDQAKQDDRRHQPTGTAEVIVAKNRCGPTGKVELGFDASTSSFRDNVPTVIGTSVPKAPPRDAWTDA